MKLLVVDDCQEQLNILVELLGETGFEVRAARNGELALSQVCEFEPHCILMDVNMPVMDGYELAQSLRTYLIHEPILIGMSGGSPQNSPTAGILKIVDRWFQKPIDMDVLTDYLLGLRYRFRQGS